MGFIGSKLHGKSVAGFDFGLWLVDLVGERVKAHGHNEAHFMWAITGAYETKAEGSSKFGNDVLVYNPPQTFHADRFQTAGAAFFTLAIDPAVVRDWDELGLPKVPTQIDLLSTRSSLRRLTQASAARTPQDEMSMEALCLEVLGSVDANQSMGRIPPAWLGPVCERLGEESNLALRDVARDADVHPTHLVRTFRTHLNCTPGEFARGRRLTKVAALLCDKTLAISEIAAKTGFSDQSHLTRQFKHAYGVTPAVYREAAKRCASTAR